MRFSAPITSIPMTCWALFQGRSCQCAWNSAATTSACKWGMSTLDLAPTLVHHGELCLRSRPVCGPCPSQHHPFTPGRPRNARIQLCVMSCCHTCMRVQACKSNAMQLEWMSTHHPRWGHTTRKACIHVTKHRPFMHVYNAARTTQPSKRRLWATLRAPKPYVLRTHHRRAAWDQAGQALRLHSGPIAPPAALAVHPRVARHVNACLEPPLPAAG